jgi:hypothetical protein
MNAAGSSETLVTIYQATLLHFSENSNLHSHWNKDPQTLLPFLSFFILYFSIYFLPSFQ